MNFSQVLNYENQYHCGYWICCLLNSIILTYNFQVFLQLFWCLKIFIIVLGSFILLLKYQRLVVPFEL